MNEEIELIQSAKLGNEKALTTLIENNIASYIVNNTFGEKTVKGAIEEKKTKNIRIIKHGIIYY